MICELFAFLPFRLTLRAHQMDEPVRQYIFISFFFAARPSPPSHIFATNNNFILRCCLSGLVWHSLHPLENVYFIIIYRNSLFAQFMCTDECINCSVSLFSPGLSRAQTHTCCVHRSGRFSFNARVFVFVEE